MWWQRIPLFAFCLAGAGLAMLLPVAHGLYAGNERAARAFAWCAMVTLVMAGILALALANRTPRITARAQLLTLVLSYVFLPAVAAAPLLLLRNEFSFEMAYFEMLSSLTTTGATVIDGPAVSPTMHLWRATVAWCGGFLIVLSAAAIMAPLNLGGFEVRASLRGTRPEDGHTQLGSAEASLRLLRMVRLLAPAYVILTVALAFLLAVAGQPPLLSLIHAMSVLSTSGITVDEGAFGTGSGRLGEMIALGFLVVAATHRGLRIRFSRADLEWLRRDPELRLMLVAVLSVAAILFLRHWLGALTVSTQVDVLGGLRALWGAIFTGLSFLTTTGFTSVDWDRARAWSGLPSSGMILLGLAMMGGGVASAAGGVKLLRCYALFRQGVRELGRLTYPSSIGGAGEAERRLRQGGAYISWVFLMLFVGALSLVMIGLTLTGVGFQDALAFSIAALTTTGQVPQMAETGGPGYAEITPMARGILCVGMVLGRLETLAVIALFNPSWWRR
ncbi:potassium transporter TrkG [Oceanicella sp. SM1341]|uniref:potassium transporter TrkG n=1 Tax=Oceanicella sp. SM1341 TaxID=1548889 RepID=UPI000E4DA4BF|nr:potassium transporter TrkG [Oceanicella sp. SM1341]